MHIFLKIVKRIPVKLATVIIRFYQLVISPMFPSACRFEPTCSQYGLEALRKYGFCKGIALTGKRILRCRPGGPHGYDPVP